MTALVKNIITPGDKEFLLSYHCADLAMYGESFDSKFINVGCVVLENINLCYSYLIH